MFELFYMGGPLFMGLLTLIFLVMLAVAVISAKKLMSNGEANLSMIKSVGLLALVIGVLGQMIGLYSAFYAIEMMGEGGVSPAMLAGGLKVSSITTIYGLIIYALSIAIYLILKGFLKK